MNIRTLSNPPKVMGKEKIEASKTIRSDETDDREANGQQPYSDEEAHRELTEEEVEKVLAKVKEDPGVIKHGLNVQLSVENGQNVLKIIDPNGGVVKRFVERDLYFFFKKMNDNKVQLVDKTA